MSLSCRASGRPDPLVLWLYEDKRTFLLPGDKTGALEVDLATGDLVATNVRVPMDFVCLVTNEVGSAVARTEVRINKDTDGSLGET